MNDEERELWERYQEARERSRLRHHDPVLLKSDPDWIDWAPGSGPIWRHETPAQMRARQSKWGSLRRRIGRWLGLMV